MNFWDPLGLARWIRDLVSETTGSIGWNMFTNTATVEVDGKKQEYVVGSDYWVRVNGNIVGYLENDKIMIEEYDFDRDFDIAGRLMVYSYYNANDEWIQSAYGSSPPLGHSWIRYQTIHGGTVDVSLPNGQSVRGVSEFRVSTWNNGDSTALNRNWDRDHENDSHTIVSSRKITKNQQQKLLNDISTRSVHWTVINNCHVYARAVYYTVTGKLF